MADWGFGAFVYHQPAFCATWQPSLRQRVLVAKTSSTRKVRTRSHVTSLSSLQAVSGDTTVTFFATCPRGLGTFLAQEVACPEIGGSVTEIHSSGVEFTADSLQVGYAACLWLRTAMRVLQLLSRSADIRDASEDHDIYASLYSFVRDAADWTTILSGGQRSFSVQVRETEPAASRPRRQPGDSHRHRHNDFSKSWSVQDDDFDDVVGLHRSQICAKNAICDAIRDSGFDAPLKPESHACADVPLFLALHRGQASLYRDMAGASLHKRGYRFDSPMHRSSLNEAVAAGMLYFAGFLPDGTYDTSNQVENVSTGPEDQEKKVVKVIDPMCGSGTLLIEAALCRLHIAPGLYRQAFAFQNWHDFHKAAFKTIVEKALKSQRADSEINMVFYGSDESEASIDLARRNLRRLRMTDLVRLQVSDIAKLRVSSSSQDCLVLSNPPWGRRLGGEVDAWDALGRFVRQHASGGQAVVLSGDASLTKGLRMRARAKLPIRIGNVDCRALAYNIYSEPSSNQGDDKAAFTDRNSNSNSEVRPM
jgi:23S rRNA (guanine2445-N2)-methyltransferase / 23S rRNA (guanine2069-N7)-methyltransferase